MTTFDWQLQKPIDAIIFDCDGTLSQIEGVDELAKSKGVHEKVSKLTEEAMSHSGLNPHLYQERLNLIAPDYDLVYALGLTYYEQQTPDAVKVIQILKRLKKQIYLLSAGVNPAIKRFGALIKIPTDNIFAVDLYFDPQGHYLDFDRKSPLIHNQGKGEVVNKIRHHFPEIVYVGDGMNDLAVKAFVRRFIGYGGVYYRENIKKAADLYISTRSLSPLLPFILTPEEKTLLSPTEMNFYQEGLKLI